MPTPSPTPSESEILTAAEIAMVSYEYAETMIAADSSQPVADAKWAATLTQISDWADVGSDAGDIKRVDTIEFFEGAAAKARLAFRNTLRLRYGLAPLLSETAGTGTNPSSLQWF